MNPTETPAEESPTGEYDVWSWHTEGQFPTDQPPEHGYVHIGMYLVWLIDVGMLDSDWATRAGVGAVVERIRQRSVDPCALRDKTDGRLSADMLTDEGDAFTAAYYAPEYGYTSDWNRAFGRLASRYAVPDDWASYDRIGPVIEHRFDEWVKAGRPDLMPMPRLLGALLRLATRGRR
jgi:hypothetical protein